MKCQACQEGRHWDCGLQTWCDCDCDPVAALYDFGPDDELPEETPEDYFEDLDDDESSPPPNGARDHSRGS